MCALLGGSAAEEVFIGHISSGAVNDLERVTKQAYAMISYMGMSDQLPNLSYYDSQDAYGFTKPYSEQTAHMIDQEVQKMINEQYARAKSLLQQHADGHKALADVLMKEEVIFADDLEKIFGVRQWKSRTEEILDNPKRETTEAKTIESLSPSGAVINKEEKEEEDK